MSQLALPLQLDDYAVFDSFLASGNEPLVALLENAAATGAGDGCWLFGTAPVGKTHLLQAVCARAGDRSVFVPLTLLDDVGPDVLAGLEGRALVCVDDVHHVAGKPGWERALFNLYNGILAEGGQLIAAAAVPQRECGFRLPDLSSRFSQLPTYRVAELSDGDRQAALQLRSTQRGLELPDETARYLLSRSRRDMRSLYRLLDTLDHEALRAKRRLTIPFVRDVLNNLEGCASR